MLDGDPELLPLLPHIYDLKRAPEKDRADAVRRFKAILYQSGFTVDDLLKKGPRWGPRVQDEIAVLLGGEEKIVDLYWGNEPQFWMWVKSLHAFRQTDAFHNRVRSSGMLTYWQKHGWPDLCRAQGADDFVCD